MLVTHSSAAGKTELTVALPPFICILAATEFAAIPYPEGNHGPRRTIEIRSTNEAGHPQYRPPAQRRPHQVHPRRRHSGRPSTYGQVASGLALGHEDAGGARSACTVRRIRAWGEAAGLVEVWVASDFARQDPRSCRPQLRGCWAFPVRRGRRRRNRGVIPRRSGMQAAGSGSMRV